MQVVPLRANGGCRVAIGPGALEAAQLGRHSFVTAQTMADMITTLEQRSMIERHRDRADRRRLPVALTPQGQELLDRYRDHVNARESRMLSGLTKPQVRAMRRGLRTCHANLAGDRNAYG
jgi:DNA-binding MarR family transcriptional regulator